MDTTVDWDAELHSLLSGAGDQGPPCLESIDGSDEASMLFCSELGGNLGAITSLPGAQTLGLGDVRSR